MKGTSAIQLRNSEMVDILSADFQKRCEAAFVWGNVVSIYSLLPQLRGFWPFSSVDENGDLYDLSGQGHTLKNNGSTPFGCDSLIPYADMTPGSSQYFYSTNEDGLEIPGSLTVGGWFWFDAFAATQGLIGIGTTLGNQRSFMLYATATPTIVFAVSSDGINYVSVTSSETPTVSGWHHIVGRFQASTEIAVFYDDIMTTNKVGVPASLAATSDHFRIGDYQVAEDHRSLDGRAALCALCATNLSSPMISAWYAHTRYAISSYQS